MNSLSAAENTLMEREIHDICHRYQSVVIKKDDNTITIASSELPNDELLAALRFISGRIVNVEIWPLARIESVLHQNISLHHLPEEESSLLPPTTDIHADENDAPVIQLINQTLLTSIQRRASDIHFEPFQQGYRIRIRVDGALHLLSSPSPQMNASIAARLKIMAKLNIAEKRLPQDGQFDWYDTRHNYAIRMATLPTIHGEKIVLRILNTMRQLSLDQLGIPEQLLNQLQQKLTLPQGMILVTGPTGSGKTVTLYSCLQYLNQNKKNICSVEDPVEIPLNGINQTQINSKIDLNFAKVLRALLRQDPDVIMVGEIRDSETAEISVKAAQTGHLVLSTLHTNSTVDTLSRLQNLGISGYMAASCIKLIIAQRLVRKLCLHCRNQQTDETVINIGNNSIFIRQWIAVGCKHCFSGYYGRTAIYEFLEITHELQQILSQQDPQNLQKTIIDQRKETLFSSGILLIEQGITTLEEIYQVTGKEEQ
ncbi:MULTISPECIES: type II secretion system protein GspE [Photorhabdus]|uniref:Protein transport protein HofB n=2 Tax=Photorhabdus asymbiotica TaxID=291112 RepID=A0ABX9STU9_9GAMM|nr:type II secretion system protein GspE [Photorhabdus asymbiotica]RKS66813.1 protein transport protein HofB [Photorhabdus asymbiotica]CAQ83220.1 putative integral membrane protein involved in biogenesis of fimbriae protein transport, dna uptake (putative integral membrane protei hofb) [Photorhabdus asymbiotica]